MSRLSSYIYQTSKNLSPSFVQASLTHVENLVHNPHVALSHVALKTLDEAEIFLNDVIRDPAENQSHLVVWKPKDIVALTSARSQSLSLIDPKERGAPSLQARLKDLWRTILVFAKKCTPEQEQQLILGFRDNYVTSLISALETLATSSSTPYALRATFLNLKNVLQFCFYAIDQPLLNRRTSIFFIEDEEDEDENSDEESEEDEAKDLKFRI